MTTSIDVITIQQAIEAGRYVSEEILAGGCYDTYVTPSLAETKRLVARYDAFGQDSDALSGIRQSGPLTFTEFSRLVEHLDEDRAIQEGAASFDEVLTRWKNVQRQRVAAVER